VPSNADAFYHARRILDVVMTGAPVAQFDASTATSSATTRHAR